jgi:hypothetical protein
MRIAAVGAGGDVFVCRTEASRIQLACSPDKGPSQPVSPLRLASAWSARFPLPASGIGHHRNGHEIRILVHSAGCRIDTETDYSSKENVASRHGLCIRGYYARSNRIALLGALDGQWRRPLIESHVTRGRQAARPALSLNGASRPGNPGRIDCDSLCCPLGDRRAADQHQRERQNHTPTHSSSPLPKVSMSEGRTEINL